MGLVRATGHQLWLLVRSQEVRAELEEAPDEGGGGCHKSKTACSAELLSSFPKELEGLCFA